jgi:hypothetical protein
MAIGFVVLNRETGMHVGPRGREVSEYPDAEIFSTWAAAVESCPAGIDWEICDCGEDA